MKNEWIPIGFLPLWIAFHVFMYRRPDLTRAQWGVTAEDDPARTRFTRTNVVITGVLGGAFLIGIAIKEWLA